MDNTLSTIFFLIFVAATFWITWWAARKNTSSKDYYNARGGISGLQNGVAMAGDFMSAASFLGITGLIFLGGFDGLVLALGAFTAWPLLTILFARRVHNLGSYTLVDVVSLRLDRTPVRIVTVIATLVIVILYLIAQMVGAGKLIELLFGWPYELALISVSSMVLAYVAFGGMLATTWVQIIKAVLLLVGATLCAVLVLSKTGFSLDVLLAGAAEQHPRGMAILAPGALFEDPIQVLTILVSLCFGTLGLPHILMRLFTVPSMQEAQKSALVASFIMGYFYIVIIVLGFGTAYLLYGNPQYFSANGGLSGGGNMAAIHLADAVGGGLLMAFMAAVSFATILAVVAGLTVSAAAAISHDLYSEVLCQGEPDPARELLLTRITTLVVGVIAITLGILFENENVAFVATMPMVISASVTFPLLFLSLYWGGLTTRGAVYGAVTGLGLSVTLIVLGPQVWVSVLGNGAPLFPYDYPALFTLPLAVFVTVVVSVTDRSARATIDRDGFVSLLRRSEFGEELQVK